MITERPGAQHRPLRSPARLTAGPTYEGTVPGGLDTLGEIQETLKMRMIYNYYKDIHRFNLPFSILLGVLGVFIGEDKVNGFFSYFFLTLLTGGFVLSLFFYQLMYANQYYFYYNRGLSKLKLISISFGVNLFLFIIYKCLNTY